MERIRWVAIVVSLVALALLLSPGPAEAQTGSRNFSHSVGLGVWLSSAQLTEPAGTLTWRTMFWVLEYRGHPEDARWGFRLRYGTGAQSGWGGTGPFAGATSGRDSFWSADVSYRFPQPQGLNLWGFAGYDSFSFDTSSPAGTRRASSGGPRIGVDAEVPLQLTSAPSGRGWHLSIVGSLAWSPSNSVTSVSGVTTTTATGSSTEWMIALRVRFDPGRIIRAADGAEFHPAVSTRLREHIDGFAAELGTRARNASGASDFGWSGLFLSFAYTF